MNNLKFEGPADPNNLEKVDEFLWRGQVVTQTYLHTKVLWKGLWMLSIKKLVDYDYPKENGTSALIADDDDEPAPDSVKREPEVKWMLHTNLDWLKYNYGEFGSLFEAREGATKEVAIIASHIQKAWARRPIKED
jgi:hypothetical protein